MANRFSLRLRNIYGDPESDPTGGERLARGVSGAIDTLLEREAQKRAEAEADRQEANEFAKEGFEPVARGTERLAPPPRMRTPDFNPNANQPSPVPRGITPTFPQVGTTPSRSGIGSAIGFELEQQQPGAGMETVRSRSGQQFRRPGRAMREEAESQRRIQEESAIATARARAQAATPRPGAMTQEQRIQIENLRTDRAVRLAQLRAQSQRTLAAMQGGRASNAQLTALRALQSSYDREASEIRDQIAAAQRAYRDEDLPELRQQLIEVTEQAEEVRGAIAGMGGSAVARPSRGSSPADDVRAAAEARRNRTRVAPRQSRPSNPPPTGRTVPPPVKPR